MSALNVNTTHNLPQNSPKFFHFLQFYSLFKDEFKKLEHPFDRFCGVCGLTEPCWCRGGESFAGGFCQCKSPGDSEFCLRKGKVQHGMLASAAIVGSQPQRPRPLDVDEVADTQRCACLED